MIELFILVLVFLIISYLVVKAVGSILKGLLFLFLAILIYYFIYPSTNFQLISISNFIKTPIERLKGIFLKMDIVSISQSTNSNLIIVIKNTGYLPLNNFSVKIDGKEAKIINSPKVLLPNSLAALEVEWRENFKIVEVDAIGIKATYRYLPSEPAT